MLLNDNDNLFLRLRLVTQGVSSTIKFHEKLLYHNEIRE